MKYILEFETLEELLIAQAKVNGTKVTDERDYNKEIKNFHKSLIEDKIILKENSFAFKLRFLIHDIVIKEANIRKSMFLQ